VEVGVTVGVKNDPAGLRVTCWLVQAEPQYKRDVKRRRTVMIFNDLLEIIELPPLPKGGENSFK
jgi:hypothetical protein